VYTDYIIVLWAVYSLFTHKPKFADHFDFFSRYTTERIISDKYSWYRYHSS